MASAQARTRAAIACIALILVAANILAGRYLHGRFDASAARVNTLSEATAQTLAGIDEAITLVLYYSPRLGEMAPAYGAYAQRVRKLLAAYVDAADGKLRLETRRPLVASQDEDRAAALGLEQVPLNGSRERLYFGLVGINAVDERGVIAVFDPARERFLEYDLTRLVQGLAPSPGGVRLADLRRRSLSAPRLELVDQLRQAAEDRRSAEHRALGSRLAQQEARLRALLGGDPADGKSVLKGEQVRAIDQLRAEIAAIRARLSRLAKAADPELAKLKLAVQFADIALMPLLVMAAALAAVARRRRSRRRPPVSA